MQPADRPLTIVRGDDYTHDIYFTSDTDPFPALNWTGRTFAAQIRLFADDTAYVAFTVDGSGLATGHLVLSLTKTQTAAIVPRVYAWDLQMTESNAKVTTLAAGDVTVVADVTR